MMHASATDDILASLDNISAIGVQPAVAINAAQSNAVSAATQDITLDGGTPTASYCQDIALPPTEPSAEAASALLRAAEQQRRLAQVLPDEAARAEMLSQALEQEAQANAILAKLRTQPLPGAAAGAAHGDAGGCGTAAALSADVLPEQPLLVRAVLRRDSADLFKFVLKESAVGVTISKLVASDAADERSMLREGDVRTATSTTTATPRPLACTRASLAAAAVAAAAVVPLCSPAHPDTDPSSQRRGVVTTGVT